MKKYVNGKYIPMTSEEITAMQKEAARAELAEKSRPLTADEVNRLFIMQNINTVITDDATASRAVEFHPEMEYNGKLIPAKTRINWHGTLKRASVDIWDTEQNNPDNAPTLWENINYREGYRIIPETITAGLAFDINECGWWNNNLYQSTIAANVYTPAQYPAGWILIQ